MEDFSQEQKIMQNNLLRLLDYTSDLLRKNNISFWLSCGTLLGAVREGKLIPWDNDIDIAMWEKDAYKLINLESTILADGYLFEHVQEQISEVEGRYKNWNFTKDWNPKNYNQSYYSYRISYFHYHLDIRYMAINEGVAFCISYPLERCPCDDLQNLDEIKLEGKMYPCPRNPKELLKANYGEGWEIPKIEANMIPRLSDKILKKYSEYLNI